MIWVRYVFHNSVLFNFREVVNMRVYQLVALIFGLLALLSKTAQIKQSNKNHMTRFSAAAVFSFLLINALGFLAPVTHAANLLFKSNFGEVSHSVHPLASTLKGPGRLSVVPTRKLDILGRLKLWVRISLVFN